MSDTLFESFTEEDETTHDEIRNARWAGQYFSPQLSHNVTSVMLFAKRTHIDGTAGNVTASIYNAGDDHLPDGAALVSKILDASEWATGNQWHEFVFATTPTLYKDQEYCLCFTGDSFTGADVINVPIGNAEDYSRGARLVYATGSWSVTTKDINFKDYGLKIYISHDKTYSKKLVTVGGDEVWYESSPGTMEELTDATGDIDTALPLQIFPAYQKVFIANKTNLKVIDFKNTKIDLGSGNELTDPPAHGDILTQDTSGAIMVVDFVDSTKRYIYGYITSGTFDTTNTVSSGNTIATMNPATFTPDSVTLPTIPHWYDWTVYPDCKNSDGVTLDYGELPNEAILACLYRGRIVLSGNSEYPFQWYMSRQGNPWDFAYTATDAQSAVSGGNSDAGEIGDIITTLIPYKDDYLIFGCANSMWLLIGDPMAGGSLAEFDLTTGIYGPFSFCWDNEGNLYFWGAGGIYKTTVPGIPVCISGVSLPKLVEDEAAQSSTHRITMAYDRTRTGILICITKLSDGTNSNYFLDLKNKGIFPETYPEECSVHSQFFYEAIDPDYNKLIVGCYDGYLRFFDDSAEADNIGESDEAIDAYVTFGPLQMTDDLKYEGIIVELICITAGGASNGSQSDSNDVECKIFTANSAEEILEQLNANSSPRLTKTIKAPGRQRGGSIKRRIRGVYAGVRLGNSVETETWSLEQLLIDAIKVGRFK